MQILQFTDPHLYGNAGGNLRGVETDSSLRTVLEDAYAAVPDYRAIMVTGDLVQDDPSGYLRFKSIFSDVRRPVLCVPGNHDDPAAMQRSLSAAPFHYCGALALGAWQFIMLDSVLPGQVGGRLSGAELQRLDRLLAGSALHAIVCMHHHPVAMHSHWLDQIGVANAAEFWQVIDAHPHVRAVVWGHVHQSYSGQRGAVHLFATPSTGAQFLPHSDRYAVDSRPPAYRRFDLQDDGRIDTEVRWVEPAASPVAAVR